MLKAIERVQCLAAKQKALNVELVYKGNRLGKLGSAIQIFSNKEISASQMNDLNAWGRKLVALERMCFDFNNLNNRDLGALDIPPYIPGTEIEQKVKIFRNTGIEQPWFQVDFYRPSYMEKETAPFNILYGPSSREEGIASFNIRYDPFSESLSVYTCSNFRVEHGQKLQLEVVPRAFLASAKIARLLGLPVKYAYAYYELWGEDYERRDSGRVRPVVQERIDRVSHVLEQLNFTKGIPKGSKEEEDQAMMITLVELEKNCRENWWNLAYTYRFGKEFANMLDKQETEERLKIKESVLNQEIEKEIRHWHGGEGALNILNLEKPFEEDLLSVILDKHISPDIAKKALLALIQKTGLSRTIRQDILDLYKLTSYDVKSLSDEELESHFWMHLPNSVKFALLESKDFSWKIKKEIFFNIPDRGSYAVLESQDILNEIRRILKGFNREQIEELLILASDKRNSGVRKVYTELLQEAFGR